MMIKLQLHLLEIWPGTRGHPVTIRLVFMNINSY